MATWRNGYAEDCKSLYPSSILGVASTTNREILNLLQIGLIVPQLSMNENS